MLPRRRFRKRGSIVIERGETAQCFGGTPGHSDGELDESLLIVTTGGTIDKSYFDALSTYQIGDPVVARLLEQGRVTRTVEIVELLRKDSLELSAYDRTLILEHVRDAAARHVVITHGTDTMAETADLLMTVSGKTIVLAGAFSPARFADSDASFNLGRAVATAQVASPGVYITMNGTVFQAGAAAKDRDRGTFIQTTDQKR